MALAEEMTSMGRLINPGWVAGERVLSDEKLSLSVILTCSTCKVP